MKKRTLIALFIIAIMTCAIGFVGCNLPSSKPDKEFEAAFKENVETQVFVSKDIDFDDYIVRVEGAEHSITVSYYNLASNQQETVEIKGQALVFYPKYVGEHKITYKVTYGGVTKTNTMTLSVISDPPTLTISHTAQTLDMPESGSIERYFDYLMDNASMVIKPVTAKTEVIGVSFRGVTVGLESKENEWQKLDFVTGSESFVFTEIGEYQFFVRATSETNTAEDYFLVNVIKDPSAGTKCDDTAQTPVVKTGKGVVYSEDNPYTFKLMSSNLSDLNYVVVNDRIGDGEKLSLLFKGKNAPQLGFFVKPDPANGSYDVKNSTGGFFSFVAKESSGHKWTFFFPNMLNGNACRTPIPGSNDFGIADLEKDKTYLMQYSLSFVQHVDARNADRLKVNVEIYEVVDYFADKTVSSCTISEKLYEIGIYGEFYYAEGETFDFVGESVIYGDIRNNIDIQYISDPTKIKVQAKQEKAVEGTENLYTYNANAKINDDGSVSATLKKGKIIDDKQTGISDQLGYLGVQNSGFGMGKTITIDFVGKNLPGIGLYLDKSPEGYVVGGATASGTGFYIGNGNVSGELESIGQRITVNGTNRLDPGGTYRGNAGYPPYYGRINGLSYNGSSPEGSADYNRSAKMGYNLLEDGKQYRFELKDVSYEIDTTFNTFALNYKLYDMSGSEPVLLEDVTRQVNRDFSGINFNSQTIAFFSSIHQDISFSYTISGDLTPYPKTEKLEGATILKPATITEKQNDEKVAIEFGGTFDYVGLGEYNVGDAIEFTFIGKNIPNVGLFANKNGVNPIGGGTENTGIFLQTSGYGAGAYDTRLIITGPFLLDAGKEEYFRTVAGLENFEWRPWVGANKELAVDIATNSANQERTSVFGISMLENSTKYVYRVETAQSSTAGNVVIKLTLYKVIDDNRVLVGEFTKDVKHYMTSLENTYAVAYGTGGFSNKDIEFVYEKFAKQPETFEPSGTLTLNVAQVTEIQDNKVCVGFTGDYDYKGLGSYSVGDTLQFTFKGNNIPNVALFTNKSSVNAIGGGTENTGIFLQTSGYYGEVYNQRLYISGPFMLDAGSVDAYKTLPGREDFVWRTWLGANIEYGVQVNSPFGISNLDANTNYVYRISTAAGSDASKVVLLLKLYSVKNGQYGLVESYQKEIVHNLPSLEGTYAIVYGAGNQHKRAITFDYEVNPDYDITVSAGSLTLNVAQVTEIQDNKVCVGFTGNYDYKGLGSYAVGDTLQFTFKGNNIPNVALFTNKSSVNAIGGGTENTGIFLQTSGYYGDVYNQRLYIAGPFMLDAGSVDAYRTLPGQENFVWRTFLGANMEYAVQVNSPFGISNLDANTEYVYRVSTLAGSDASKVLIILKLYTVKDEKYELVASYEKEITHNLPTLEGTYAIVYGAGNHHNAAITFGYEIRPEYDIPVTSGTVTLDTTRLDEIMEGDERVGFRGSFDYLGLGEYKVGDTLQFKFKGKNIPNVGLFVNKNGVNAVNGGTENTGIFVQTSCFYGDAYNNRFYVTGPFLLDAGSVGAYRTLAGKSDYVYNRTVGENLRLAIDHSDPNNTSLLSMGQLDENTDYIYRISTSKCEIDGKKITLSAVLYKVVDGEVILVKNIVKTFEHYLPTLENTYAVAYGAGRFVDAPITFEYDVNPVEAYEGRLTLANAVVDYASTSGFTGYFDNRGLGKYEAGDTLEFRFVGKNIPNVGLFVNKNGVNAISGGTDNTGIFIQTSHVNATHNGRMYYVGPFLLDPGSKAALNTINVYASRDYAGELCKNVNQHTDTDANAISMGKLQDGVKYVYRVSTRYYDEQFVFVKCSLASVNDEGVETEIRVFEKDVRLCTISLHNTYAVVYGANVESGTSITFDYKIIKKA